MLNLETTTAPTVPVVATADMKLHLRLNDDAEDALLAEYVQGAADLFTRQSGYALTTTTFRLNLDKFPDNSCQQKSGRNIIYVPVKPVASLTSVQYLDTDGVWQTLAGTTADLTNCPARIILPATLPVLHASTLPAVRVNFVAGVALAASVPALARIAVKLAAAEWYAMRESFVEVERKPLPQGWDMIVKQFWTGIQNPEGWH